MEKYGYDFEPEAKKENKIKNLVKTSSEKDEYLTEGLEEILTEKRRGKNDSSI